MAALDALVAAGADIEASGAVRGGGTPLADACGFGQWRAARRLLEHGARTTLRDEATLGLLDRLRARVAAGPLDADDLDSAFWGACHGGQLASATYLLDQGAALDRVGYDEMTPLDIAVSAGASDLVAWLRERGARTRGEL